MDLLDWYLIIAVNRLSEKILAQSIITTFVAASINGNHSDENLLISGIPNNLQSMATAKQYEEVREPVLYILFLSILSGSSFLDQSLVVSARLGFSAANFLTNCAL